MKAKGGGQPRTIEPAAFKIPECGIRLIPPLEKLQLTPRLATAKATAGARAAQPFTSGPVTGLAWKLETRRRRCMARDRHELRRSCPLEHAARDAPEQPTGQGTRIRPMDLDPTATHHGLGKTPNH